MRNAETGKARFRLRAEPRRAFVANFAPAASRRTRERRYGRRVIMRFDFHQDLDGFIAQYEKARRR